MLQEGALFTLTAVSHTPRATSPSTVGRHLFPASACYEQSRSDALECLRGAHALPLLGNEGAGWGTGAMCD